MEAQNCRSRGDWGIAIVEDGVSLSTTCWMPTLCRTLPHGTSAKLHPVVSLMRKPFVSNLPCLKKVSPGKSMEITVHPEMWPHSLCLAQGPEQQRAHSCVEREIKSTAKERQANVYKHQERRPLWVVVIFFPLGQSK